MPQRLFFVGLAVVCVGVLALYLSRVGDIALVAAFDSDPVRAAVARSQMGTEFSGTYWRYRLFFRDLFNLCVVFFFVDFTISRRRSSGVLFVVVLLIASFSAVVAIEKGPLAKLIVMLFLAYIATRDGRYWNRYTKYMIAFLTAAMVFSYITFTGVPDKGAALDRLLGRISTGQIIPAYFYLELFPQNIDYLWGRSFPNPGGVLAFEPYPLTREIAKVIFPNLRDVVGTAPTVYWAEMYANFGPFGVWLSSVWIGFGVFIVGNIVERLPTSVPVVALWAFLAIHYGTLTGTGASAYLFDTTLFAVVGVSLIALALGYRRSGDSVAAAPGAVSGQAGYCGHREAIREGFGSTA